MDTTPDHNTSPEPSSTVSQSPSVLCTRLLPMGQVLDAVYETVMQDIEKDIARWKRKSIKATSLNDVLKCKKKVQHFEGLRSHMRGGLFDLQDQVALLTGPFFSLEATVDAVMKLVHAHQQGYSGAGAARPAAPAQAEGQS